MLNKLAICTLVLLASVVLSVALVQSEFEALIAIRSAFPALTMVAPNDAFGEDKMNYGGAWGQKSLSDTCNGGAGWDIHGILCSADGRIEGIRFTNSWGNAVSAIPPLTMPSLKKFIVYVYQNSLYPLENADSCAELFRQLSVSTLEVLEVPISLPSNFFPLERLPALYALQNLTLTTQADVDSLGIEQLFHLQSVVLRRTSIQYVADLGFLAPLNMSLRHLAMPEVALISPANLDVFTSLESLTISCSPLNPSNYVDIISLPVSLSSLSLLNWPSAPFQVHSATLKSLDWSSSGGAFPGFTGFPSSLTSLSLTGLGDSTTWPSSLPPNLESLTLKSPSPGAANLAPGLFDNCHALKVLEIDTVENPEWDQNFPSLASTSLETVIFRDVHSMLDYGLVLCTAPPFTLQHLSFPSSTLFKLPDCMSNFVNLHTLDVLDGVATTSLPTIFENVTSNLKSLNFDSHPFEGQNPDWNALVAQFPRLEKIGFMANGPGSVLPGTPFPEASFMSLTNLMFLSLYFTHLNGTLPSNWFSAHPKLKVFDLLNNDLYGTIPANGLSNLENLGLIGNQFTDFPLIAPPGATNLKRLHLQTNKLTSLPGDDAFASMINLVSFGVDSNPNLGGPLPKIWSDPNSKIEFFSAKNCNFSGTIPPIRAPRLNYAQLSGNKLCGSLPEVTIPLSISGLLLGKNRLQGSIPSYWTTRLAIRNSLDLSFNFLGGSIPSPFISPFGSQVISALLLQENYFYGPMFNVSNFGRIDTFNVSGPHTRFEACAADPGTVYIGAQCILPTADFGCECPSYYSWCTSAVCSPSFGEPAVSPPFVPPIAPPAFECIEPPSRPTWVAPTCPLPAPSVDFRCSNGAWIASSSVIVPELAVPPGSNVIIQGNLTVGGDLIFEGNDITINIDGCFFLSDDGEIIVTLSEEQMKQLEKENGNLEKILMKTSDEGCSDGVDLSSVNVVVKPSKKSCKRVGTERGSQSNRNTLSLVFKLDSSRCNLWWIIVASVLGGIVLIVVVVMLVVTFNPQIRAKVKPFWRRSKT